MIGDAYGEVVPSRLAVGVKRTAVTEPLGSRSSSYVPLSDSSQHPIPMLLTETPLWFGSALNGAVFRYRPSLHSVIWGPALMIAGPSQVLSIQRAGLLTGGVELLAGAELTAELPLDRAHGSLVELHETRRTRIPMRIVVRHRVRRAAWGRTQQSRSRARGRFRRCRLRVFTPVTYVRARLPRSPETRGADCLDPERQVLEPLAEAGVGQPEALGSPVHVALVPDGDDA